MPCTVDTGLPMRRVFTGGVLSGDQLAQVLLQAQELGAMKSVAVDTGQGRRSLPGEAV